MPKLSPHFIYKLLILQAFISIPAWGVPTNPSLSALTSAPEFTFGTTVIGVHFDGVENAPSSSTTLWSLAYTYPFSLKRLWDRRAGLSLSLTGPYGALRSLRAYEANDFYPLRYGHTDSQFQASVGWGLEIIPETFYFGSGVQFFLSGAGNSEATLSTVNPTGRLALEVGLNSALYSGVFFRRNRTSFSLAYYQEMNPEFIQRFDAKAPIGGENTFHQPLTAKSHLYFEPHHFKLEGKYDSGPFALNAGVSYQIWSRYQPPVVLAETIDSHGLVSSTTPPDTSLRDTWNPSIGLTVPLIDTLQFQASYVYRPTAVVDLSGVGNPLDATAHIVSLGIGQAVHEGTFLPFAFNWSLFGEQHFFESRTVVKNATSAIYTFSGSAYVYSARIIIPL